MSTGRALAPLIAGLLLSSCEDVGERKEVGFSLPSALAEVSGLAAAGPDSVFTHNDEHAIVYEVRITDGQVLRTFALGEPTIEGDFEGIATAGEHIFLVTSDGLIYQAQPGENRERVPYKVHDSGIGAKCEVEGLSQAPEPDYLLLLCKRLRNEEQEARLEIYRWRIGTEHAAEEPWLTKPLEQLVDKDERAEFRPSGLEWDMHAGELLVASARNRLVLTFDREGQLLSRRRLDRNRHPKTEGITVLADRRLVLADEGSRTRKGRITAYPLD